MEGWVSVFKLVSIAQGILVSNVLVTKCSSYEIETTYC